MSLYLTIRIYIIIPKICLSVCVCVWPPFFSVLRYDRNSRLVSLEPVWSEEFLSKKNLPKYYQWWNYGQKSTPPMLFLWGKFCAFCFHLWNAIISQTSSTKDEFWKRGYATNAFLFLLFKMYRSLKKYWRVS